MHNLLKNLFQSDMKIIRKYWVTLVLACNLFIIISAQQDELRAYPRSIVFNAVQERSDTSTRAIFVFSGNGNPLPWIQTTDVSWLTTDKKEGVTEGILRAGISYSGLLPGIYFGNIWLASAQSDSRPVLITVSLIVNPDVPVKIATWKGGHDAAMSVSVDDGQGSAFEELQRNGFVGTYVANGISPPPFYTRYYQAGMELGAHLANHLCYPLSDSILQYQEILPNIQGIADNTPEPYKDIISLVWPCGVTNYREQEIAGRFFLSARGYNLNQLEEATPENFMNLKSFNSHEHTPFPPQDLKTEVDSALLRQKWYNLVLHSMTNDDGAIEYARSKNIWVNTIGTVIKYILQRDRFILRNFTESDEKITFEFSRLPISPVAVRNFEDAFGPEDLTTLQIDIADNRIVRTVIVDGEITPFQTMEFSGNKVILADIKLQPEEFKTMEIIYLKSYTLLQNYPNPCREYTYTEFNIANDSQVTIEVFNVMGQKISTLLNQNLKAGSYKVKWEPGNVPSGTYYLSLKGHNFRDMIKISLVKQKH
jgi:hypothetical protein